MQEKSFMPTKQHGKGINKIIRQSVYENYTLAKKIRDKVMEDYWGYILECLNEMETKKIKDNKKWVID